MTYKSDFLVIGTGLAGLSFALKASQLGSVTLISKVEARQSNSWRAQGGISAVMGEADSFEQHIQDTLEAGAGLCDAKVVQNFVQQSPQRIQELVDWGVHFDQKDHQYMLTKEGAHSQNRILHIKDHTGRAIQEALLNKIQNTANITLLENQFTIDLITNKKLNPDHVGNTICHGAYVFDKNHSTVQVHLAKATVLATGGAGKIYLYTSNWDGATGDGIAIASRAGARVENLELMQFHPTCLYHPEARNFLISEALRGEGGEILNSKGEAFLKKAHKLGSLAPRDIVAKAIDHEMKNSGAECVYLDMTHKSQTELKERFPEIYKKCADYGIYMEKTPIPVVPAAHYLCGGILIDKDGQTDIQQLYAIGETASSGLHGANRLASNSLLECLALSHNCYQFIKNNFNKHVYCENEPPQWIPTHKEDEDESVVITHMWDEIRRLMWNYVGIVRSDKRLKRALNRLDNLRHEIREYYWDFKLTSDILELRNLALVAQLTVRSAMKRKESRGVHFNLDYPEPRDPAQNIIL